MNKAGLVLRHFNKVKPINCTLVSGDVSKLFTVKVDDNDSFEAEMQKGDPVLIGLLNGEELKIHGGSVVGANPKEDLFILCSNEAIDISKELEKRQYERYPVSLPCDIKLESNSIRENACVKDISYSGMCVYSEGDYELNDIVQVSIYLSNTVSNYDGTILRKSRIFGRNEYGIQILHRDKNAMYATEAHITSFIQSEKEVMLRHLLNAQFKI